MEKIMFGTWLQTAIILCLIGNSIGSFIIQNDSIISADNAENHFQNNVNGGDLLVLIGTYPIVQSSQSTMDKENAFEAEVSTLKDRMSILDMASLVQGKSFAAPSEDDMSSNVPHLCGEPSSNSTAAKKAKVVESIQRTLHFFETHLDQLSKTEAALALAVLMAVDDKHEIELQNVYPMSEWVSQICGSLHDIREENACKAVTRMWRSREGRWKSESIIQKYAKEFKSVGSENEVIWGKLNGECQMALLNRCEVPYVCERTLFDPTPRSQYMLTHQLLQRIFSHLGSCKAAKFLIGSEVNYRMCGKMYQEAKLISALKTPEILRDLFVEQIALCGYLGLPNFLREDWLDLIISWQSKSDYGCFVKDKNSEFKYMSTDRAIKRLPTDAERREGMNESDEECLPHFTSVSLMALTAYWDYLEEKCY